MPGNRSATLHLGNLDERVDERLLYEIMVQAGPLVDVFIPRDKGSKRHKGYGFAEYETEESAQYALSLFSGLISLFNRSLRISLSGDRPTHQAADETGPGTPNQLLEVNRDQQKFYPHDQAITGTANSLLEVNGHDQRPFLHNYLPCPPLELPRHGLINAHRLLSTTAHAQSFNTQSKHFSQRGLHLHLDNDIHPYHKIILASGHRSIL